MDMIPTSTVMFFVLTILVTPIVPFILMFIEKYKHLFLICVLQKINGLNTIWNMHNATNNIQIIYIMSIQFCFLITNYQITSELQFLTKRNGDLMDLVMKNMIWKSNTVSMKVLVFWFFNLLRNFVHLDNTITEHVFEFLSSQEQIMKLCFLDLYVNNGSGGTRANNLLLIFVLFLKLVIQCIAQNRIDSFEKDGGTEEIGLVVKEEEAIKGSELCIICHGSFIHPRILKCNHCFCRDCILAWKNYKVESTCPLCRRPIENSIASKRENHCFAYIFEFVKIVANEFF